jgi:hypothetical protein
MGIGSYKEAQRYRMRTNKNLTRSFYLDTKRTLDEEPFAWETEVQPDMVVPPQDVLPKNPIPNMPSAPGIPDPQFRQLELAEGGRVGFKDGSKPTRSTIYKITRANHPEQGKYAYHGFNMKTKYFDTKKQAEDFKKFRLQNKVEQQTIKITDDFIKKVKEKIEEGKSKIQVANELNVPVKRIDRAFEKGNIKLPENIVDNLEYRSFVKNNYKDKTVETIAKELFTDKKIPLSTKKSRVHQIIGTLIANGELEPIPSGLKTEIRNRYGFGKSSKYEIDKATRERRDLLISKTSSPSTEYQIRQLKTGEGPQLAHRLGLEESTKLGQQYDIGNLGIDPPKVNQEIAKSFENLRDKLVIERDAIAKKIEKNPSLELRKQLLNVNEKIKQVVDASDGRIQAFVLDEQTLEPIKYLGIKPRELAYGVIDETTKDFDLKEINKIIKDANKTGTTTPEDWEKIKKYQMFVANLENEVGMAKKEKVADVTKNLKDNLIEYLNNNPEEVKAFRTAGIVCRRSVGGKVDTECLAENIVKEVEKLETGTDLQKSSALNKFKNATKLGAGLAEEVIGFGKGVAGRTLGPLVALNSALEQFTSGNYREGVRKIASLADLTTLVGDPLGFEKMRTEGTIEDVRKKIGKENQTSLDRILEFKDKYYQLQDINTKLERIQSAAEGQYDPETPGVDQTYINELKKQQTDLNKIINNPKYQNIRQDYLNVGNAVKNEIFGRNINAPEQNKYVFETAAQEQLKSILGEDFYDELSDENQLIFKNLNASEKIKPVYFETPIQSPDDSMREGFAEGGGSKIGRRGFLGLLTGAAVAPELMKALKGTGQAGKIASKIKFEKVQGMYSWFPDLVEKIKVKGKPFEEKEIIMEASYKHEAKGYGGLPKGIEKVTKHVDGDTEFLLREYPDGRIAVDIHSPRNQEGSSTPVTLYYRPTMELKYYSGTKVEPAEFKVLEKEPRYFANGPDDVDIEMSEMRKVPGKDPIYGDVEAAERFATGDIKNRKIIPVKQSRREQMEDAPTDFIEETSPYGPDTF